MILPKQHIFTTNEKLRQIQNFGLVLLGFFCLLYAIFARTFAELNIQLSLLDFPIFIGEIFMLLCFVLVVAYWSISPPTSHLLQYVFVLYFIWLILKVVIGYSEWGCLTLRNAALFYYPFFSIVGYCFFNKYAFVPRTGIYIFLIIYLAFHFLSFSGYHQFPAA